MQRKKLGCILLGITMIAGMAACGGDAGNAANVAATDNETERGTVGVKENEEVEKETETESAEPEIHYTTPEMKGEISVNVYESSEWLDTSIALFEEKYPDMKVNLNVFFNGTDTAVVENGSVEMSSRPAGQTREDYITWLNTQLMSGDADDIVITSVGLPLGHYETMGVFEDLTPYLEAAEEINEENYYMNIFDAYRTEDGKLYELPISATAVPTFLYQRDVIENTGIDPTEGKEAITWREALDAAKALYNASTLENSFMNEPRAIVGDLLTKQVMASVDYGTGEVHLDKEKVLEKLAVFEELKDFEMMPEDFDYRNHSFYKFYDLAYMPDINAAVDVVTGNYKHIQWKHDDGNVYLCPYYVYDYGINSKSENKALAWEFLRFLVSEEAQTLPSCPNAGVNKAGLKARVEAQFPMYYPEATEEDVQKAVETVDGWVSQITAYQPEDTDLIQLSEGTFAEFCAGECSAEEMAERLEERLLQYMNE